MKAMWILFVCLLPVTSFGQDFQTIQTESVVVVESKNGAGSRRGSGFFWQNNQQVVTAFHVIAGSEHILVYRRLPDGDKVSKAKVQRILRAGDLALLALEKNLGGQPLVATKSLLLVDEELKAVGYPFNIKNPGPTTVSVRNKQTVPLDDLITSSVRLALDQLKFPNLDWRVIDLEGSLLEGHSGAPILDRNGLLVGIASGGLEQGTIQRCWATPISAINQLMASPDRDLGSSPLWKTTKGLFTVYDPKDSDSTTNIAIPFVPREKGFNILILPFEPLEEISGRNTNVEVAITRRLLQESEKKELDLQVQFHQDTHSPRTYKEAKALGQSMLANLVLWGDLYEKPDTKNKVTVRYVLVQDDVFGVKTEGMSAIREAAMEDISQGVLQEDVDFIVSWAVGLQYYQERAYEAAINYFNLAKPHAGESKSLVLNTAGLAYLNLGDYPLAKAEFQKALSIRSDTLGEEHPDTITIMNNLAETLAAQGDFTAARTLHERSLAIRSRILGDEHPDTLISMNNLAAILKAQGDFTAARTLQEKCREILSRSLGEEHPHTLTSMMNLAETHRAQGDLPAARALQEKCREILSRILGEEHPHTLTSMNNLAATLFEQGDFTTTSKLQKKCLAIQSRTLGEEHPDTLTSMMNLAETHRNQGDYPAARKLQEKCLAIRSRILGDEHPYTLISMNNLAETLNAQGDFATAHKLLEKNLAIRSRILGDEHPDTLKLTLSL